MSKGAFYDVDNKVQAQVDRLMQFGWCLGLSIGWMGKRKSVVVVNNYLPAPKNFPFQGLVSLYNKGVDSKYSELLSPYQRNALLDVMAAREGDLWIPCTLQRHRCGRNYNLKISN